MKAAMPIVFICPAATILAGGIKYQFRMAETLRRAGHDAVVFEQSKTRPKWFASDVPVVGREVFQGASEPLVVMPEEPLSILEVFAARPHRKVVYCQNHFYAARSGTYADYGVSHILCSGRPIYDFCRHRHPEIPSHLVPCSVDPARFRPRPKLQRIACIPRKRQAEAVFIRDLFRFDYPEFRDIEWLPLERKREEDVAAALAESSVFLCLNHLEGFGLTPIEAMASDCVVAGFTGIGGREYATPENGFWAEEDDLTGCVRQLAEAVRLSRETGARRVAYSAACMSTAAQYTPAVFEEAVGSAWAQILSSHA